MCANSSLKLSLAATTRELTAHGAATCCDAAADIASIRPNANVVGNTVLLRSALALGLAQTGVRVDQWSGFGAQISTSRRARHVIGRSTRGPRRIPTLTLDACILTQRIACETPRRSRLRAAWDECNRRGGRASGRPRDASHDRRRAVIRPRHPAADAGQATTHRPPRTTRVPMRPHPHATAP